MKKEYQTPEIEIIEFDVEVQMLMTLSGGGNTGDNDYDINNSEWGH